MDAEIVRKVAMEAVMNNNDERYLVTQTYILLQPNTLEVRRCKIIDEYGSRIFLEVLKEPTTRIKGNGFD